jgi:hypothetical protein
VREGPFNVCKKILGEDGAIQCMLQLEAFRRKEGCFGSQHALSMRNAMSAHQWRGANVCEEEAGELKTVVFKVQPVTAYEKTRVCTKCQMIMEQHRWAEQ